MALTKSVAYRQSTPRDLGYNNEIGDSGFGFIATITFNSKMGTLNTGTYGDAESYIKGQSATSGFGDEWEIAGSSDDVNAALNDLVWTPREYTDYAIEQDPYSIDREIEEYRGEVEILTDNRNGNFLFNVGDTFYLEGSDGTSTSYTTTTSETNQYDTEYEYKLFGTLDDDYVINENYDNSSYKDVKIYDYVLKKSDGTLVDNITDLAYINPHGDTQLEIYITRNGSAYSSGITTLYGDDDATPGAEYNGGYENDPAYFEELPPEFFSGQGSGTWSGPLNMGKIGYDFDTAAGTANMDGAGGDDNQVVSVTITDPGYGYIDAPTVTFSAGDGIGGTASGTSNMQNNGPDDNSVTSVNITDGGYGYTTAPTVTFEPGNGTGGTTATGTATISGGSVTSVNVTSGGSYTDGTTAFVSFSAAPNAGDTATGTSSLADGTGDLDDSSVESVTVTNGGSYADGSSPTVTFSSPDGGQEFTVQFLMKRIEADPEFDGDIDSNKPSYIQDNSYGVFSEISFDGYTSEGGSGAVRWSFTAPLDKCNTALRDVEFYTPQEGSGGKVRDFIIETRIVMEQSRTYYERGASGGTQYLQPPEDIYDVENLTQTLNFTEDDEYIDLEPISYSDGGDLTNTRSLEITATSINPDYVTVTLNEGSRTVFYDSGTGTWSIFSDQPSPNDVYDFKLSIQNIRLNIDNTQRDIDFDFNFDTTLTNATSSETGTISVNTTLVTDAENINQSVTIDEDEQDFELPETIAVKDQLGEDSGRTYKITLTLSDPNAATIETSLGLVSSIKTFSGTQSEVNDILASIRIHMKPDYTSDWSLSYKQEVISNADDVPYTQEEGSIDFTVTPHNEFSLNASHVYDINQPYEFSPGQITDKYGDFITDTQYEVTLTINDSVAGILNKDHFVGTKEEVNSELQSVVYIPTVEYIGSFTITYEQTQTSNSIDQGSGEIAFSVNDLVVNFDYFYDTSSGEFNFIDTSGSVSETSTVVEWLWDFNDGSTSSEQNPTHAFDDNFTLQTVTLTVRTDTDLVQTATKDVYIMPLFETGTNVNIRTSLAASNENNRYFGVGSSDTDFAPKLYSNNNGITFNEFENSTATYCYESTSKFNARLFANKNGSDPKVYFSGSAGFSWSTSTINDENFDGLQSLNQQHDLVVSSDTNTVICFPTDTSGATDRQLYRSIDLGASYELETKDVDVKTCTAIGSDHNGAFLACSDTKVFYSDDNGETFIDYDLPTLSPCYGIETNKTGRWVITRGDGVWISDDVENWTQTLSADLSSIEDCGAKYYRDGYIVGYVTKEYSGNISGYVSYDNGDTFTYIDTLSAAGTPASAFIVTGRDGVIISGDGTYYSRSPDLSTEKPY